MMSFDQLMRLGPGDKMTIAFTKSPKPSWLSQQQPPQGQNSAGMPPGPHTMPEGQPMMGMDQPMMGVAPSPSPASPMAPGGLPPSPMALELLRRMRQ